MPQHASPLVEVAVQNVHEVLRPAALVLAQRGRHDGEGVRDAVQARVVGELRRGGGREGGRERKREKMRGVGYRKREDLRGGRERRMEEERKIEG